MTTRRAFLQTGASGLLTSSLGFRPRARLCAIPRAEDLAHHRDALHLSVLFGELRRHHPHPGRPAKNVTPAGGPRGRRSGPPHQSRHALSQGLVAAAGHRESAAPAQAAGAPSGSDHWEDISWDTAIDEIARWSRRRATTTFIEKDAQGRTVNRCEGIAWNGGCTDTNEFNYLVVKTMRSLGVCYLENQARV